MASHSNAASGPIMRSTLSRSTNSIAFAFAVAGTPGGVGDNKFYGSPRKREVLISQKAGDPLLKMNASGCEPAGFHGHQSNLNRFLLRDDWFCDLADCGSRAGCRQKFTPAYLSCHVILPWSAFAARCCGSLPSLR